jgi:hypothetical protein
MTETSGLALVPSNIMNTSMSNNSVLGYNIVPGLVIPVNNSNLSVNLNLSLIGGKLITGSNSYNSNVSIVVNPTLIILANTDYHITLSSLFVNYIVIEWTEILRDLYESVPTTFTPLWQFAPARLTFVPSTPDIGFNRPILQTLSYLKILEHADLIEKDPIYTDADTNPKDDKMMYWNWRWRQTWLPGETAVTNPVAVIIGMDVSTAQNYLAGNGYTYRAIRIDGVPQVVTTDKIVTRANLTINSGIVTAASLG